MYVRDTNALRGRTDEYLWSSAGDSVTETRRTRRGRCDQRTDGKRQRNDEKKRREAERDGRRNATADQNSAEAAASAVSMTGPNPGRSSTVTTAAKTTAAYSAVGRASIASSALGDAGSSKNSAFTTRL